MRPAHYDQPPWSPTPERPSPPGGSIACATCGRTLGTWTPVLTAVSFTEPDIDLLVTYGSQDVVIGNRVVLEAGIVTKGRRHRRGYRWFGPSASGRRTPPLPVQTPAVVTCWCREENWLHGLDDVGQAYATGNSDGREATLVEEMAAKP